MVLCLVVLVDGAVVVRLTNFRISDKYSIVREKPTMVGRFLVTTVQ